MPDFFYKCWVASPEEDTKDDSIYDTYRPCDYHRESKSDFFRFRIEFFKNGKCKWLQLAANDAHYFVEGTWAYKHGKIIVKNENKEIQLKFAITHLADNRMNISIAYRR